MTEKYRPNLHFSPCAGWMNDPNGLIRVDGVWHLFFQHDPNSISHGPMHWGHASSTDLVHWAEQPVALHPTELGTCYSGSAVEAADGEIKLFYTAHSHTPEGEDHQVQCLVHADRSLRSYAVEPANPVVANPGLVVFRDPKVIWHEPTGRWVMLIAEGQSIGFYGSTDLKSWTYLSSFGDGHGRHGCGPWECPDLVPLTAPNGDTVWVLLVGLNTGSYAPGSGTQYFLGQFDGMAFGNANLPETELWLDYGRDYYAAQTFFERGGTDKPTVMAWASNWLYARQTPTEAFRGIMSLPRELRLVESPDGLRVAAHAPLAARQAFGATDRRGTGRFDHIVTLTVGEELTITLFGEDQPHFIVRRTTIRRGALRTMRAAVPGMDQFAHDYAVDFAWPERGALDITVFIDRGLVELGAADGLVWITNLFFPADPEAEARVDSMKR
ncbi:glycoside hydrolase family 32 protein [Chelativorans alearense]|uniref:glycoside hydrolase family 32 protein n=1 Tax=Chelativorans alearense TaxID=2681495 RepID=UPI0013D27282|nr:glycoside hydrolase family 32 protein [Chelativorans alearense]